MASTEEDEEGAPEVQAAEEEAGRFSLFPLKFEEAVAALLKVPPERKRREKKPERRPKPPGD